LEKVRSSRKEMAIALNDPQTGDIDSDFISEHFYSVFQGDILL
jgi:hypothetical protein